MSKHCTPFRTWDWVPFGSLPAAREGHWSAVSRADGHTKKSPLPFHLPRTRLPGAAARSERTEGEERATLAARHHRQLIHSYHVNLLMTTSSLFLSCYYGGDSGSKCSYGL